MIVVAFFIIIGIVIFWVFYQNVAKKPDPAATDTEQPVSLEEPETKDETSSPDDSEKEENLQKKNLLKKNQSKRLKWEQLMVKQRIIHFQEQIHCH